MIMKKKSSLKTPREPHQRTDSIGAESTADSSRAEKSVTLIPISEVIVVADEKGSSADPLLQVNIFHSQMFFGKSKNFSLNKARGPINLILARGSR